eukprot:2882850-Rhodomonas_salina.2
MAQGRGLRDDQAVGQSLPEQGMKYKIKRSCCTGKVTKCKLHIVLLGNCMTQGEDYLDTFAPVPLDTACSIVLMLTAGGCSTIHLLDITQQFIESK